MELTVLDFEASVRFYVETLGFTVIHRREEPQFAYLDREGVQLMLEHRRFRSAARTRDKLPDRDGQHRAGPLEADWGRIPTVSQRSGILVRDGGRPLRPAGVSGSRPRRLPASLQPASQRQAGSTKRLTFAVQFSRVKVNRRVSSSMPGPASVKTPTGAALRS